MKEKQTLIGSIVRTPQFQRTRDAVLNKLKIPVHAKRFAQALTGGVEGGVITTLLEEHLPYVKNNLHQRNLQQAAYQAAKDRIKIQGQQTRTMYRLKDDPEGTLTWYPNIEQNDKYEPVEIPLTAKDLATKNYRKFNVIKNIWIVYSCPSKTIKNCYKIIIKQPNYMWYQ